MIWDEHTYLLIDEDLIESHDGTSMVRDEAWKHEANPVVGENTRALFGGAGGYRIWASCICRDGGRYRMWYTYQAIASNPAQRDAAPRNFAYAESDDGITWKPVRVRGRNNHLSVTPPDRDDLRCASMMHDPADRAYPYKAVILRRGDVTKVNAGLAAKYPAVNKKWSNHDCEGWFVWGIAHSADGFDWEMPTNNDDLVDAIIEGPAIHRALDGGYVVGNQMVSRVADVQWRKVKGWVTYDLQTSSRIPDWLFALPDHMTFVDPRYLGRQAWANTPWIQSHVGLVPARKGPSMIALHGYLYGAVGTETYAQVADVGLAISSTGYHFHQVWPFRPFIRRGNQGDWDCGLVAQKALVDTARETFCYYLASDVGNAGGCHYWLGIGRIGRDRYGYHVLRVFRDYSEPKKRRGEIVMKPLTLPAKPKLAINVSHATKHRTVRVELRDVKTGRAIPGFTFARCKPITRDNTCAKLQWKDKDAAKLAGREVVVAIEIHSPDCQFAEQHSPRVYAFYAG